MELAHTEPPPSEIDETACLPSTTANADRLRRAILQLDVSDEVEPESFELALEPNDVGST